MKKFFIGIVCLALVIILVFMYGAWQLVKDNLSKKDLTYETTTLTVGALTVVADVADTDPLRIQGLSGRRALSDGTGMIFIFEQSNFYGFRMKDMLFPIDIIGFDDTKHVVWLEENLSPESFPTVFTPTRPVQYVLEVPAWTISVFGLKLGTKATF